MNARLLSTARVLIFALSLSLLLAPAARADDGLLSAAQFLLIGPALLLLAVGAFTVLCLFALALNRGAMLADFVPRAVANSRRGRPLHFVWGILCMVFVATATAMFVNIEMLILLGVLLLSLGALLLGCGVVVAAANLGYRFAALFGIEAEDTLAAVRIGLPLFFFASAVPFVGWLQTVIAAAMGVGAVLEALARRD